jgi:hypothetical protein
MEATQAEIGRLSGRLREQAHSYNWMVLNQTEHDWLAGRLREQAHSYNWMVLNQTEHGWLAGRYREQAHSYNWIVLNQTEHGWLSGRHREQAHSYNWIVYIRAETGWLSGRLREQLGSCKSKIKRSQPSAAPTWNRGEPAPTIRPSVSSPAFDLGARREAERRDSYGESIEGGAAQQTVDDAPG